MFYDLFPKAEADELVMRAQLLIGLEQWLERSRMTQTQGAKALGITRARMSDIRRGKIGQFSLDMLVRLASRAGLKPKFERKVGRQRTSAQREAVVISNHGRDHVVLLGAEDYAGLRRYEKKAFHVSELPKDVIDELGRVVIPKEARKFNRECKKK